MGVSRIWDTQNEPMQLGITIKCKEKKSFRVWCEDYGKPNSKYADRVIIVDDKQRMINFSLPITPKALFIGIANVNDPKDTDFEVEIMQMPLKTYNIYLDDRTKRFLKLATFFCQVCGFNKFSPPPSGLVFETDDKEFTITYFQVIRDYLTGKSMNTPARIGHKSGKIEAAKVKFDKYTFAMRMIILLHEFSHKFKNPQIGLQIENEMGADINALYIYLGLGFSKVDAICVFANVFYKAQTDGNMERMRKIMDYIKRFENQEFATLN